MNFTRLKIPIGAKIVHQPFLLSIVDFAVKVDRTRRKLEPL